MNASRSYWTDLVRAAGPGCRGDREWFGLRSTHVLPLEEGRLNGVRRDVERLKGINSVIKKGLPGPAGEDDRVGAEDARHADQAEADAGNKN